MKSSTLLLLIAALLFDLSPACVQAAQSKPAAASEADPRVLLESIRANRRSLIAVNLRLSETEAAAFWPLYDRYQQEMNPIGDRMAAVVEEYISHYRELSNERALKLVEDYLAAEGDRLQVRRKYLPEFAKVLPGRTVARFYQIENKMDAVLRYDLAATIPVIDEGGGEGAK